MANNTEENRTAITMFIASRAYMLTLLERKKSDGILFVPGDLTEEERSELEKLTNWWVSIGESGRYKVDCWIEGMTPKGDDAFVFVGKQLGLNG